MTVWIALGLAVLAVLSVLVFGLVSEVLHRRWVTSLSSLAEAPAPDVAYRAVVNARSAFTRSVQSYEEAVASIQTSAGQVGTVDSPPSTTDLTTIEATRDHRRNRLIQAQRDWERVRPARRPESDAEVWLGAGELRGWNMGLIGFESVLLRIENALDPLCWVVIRCRRFRFGPAFGAERLRLGMVVEGADIDQLTGVVESAMASPEIALRPGFSVVRFIGERRAAAGPLLTTLRQWAKSNRSRSGALGSGLSDDCRRAGLRYLAIERGLDLVHPEAGLSRPLSAITLQIASGGPALLAGLWFGRRPAVEVVVGSNHRAWIRR